MVRSRGAKDGRDLNGRPCVLMQQEQPERRISYSSRRFLYGALPATPENE